MPSRRPSGGRPPRYCSASRQRTYELRRAQAEITIPLLERDIDDMRTKAGIERAVIIVLRKCGVPPRAPPPPTKRLRIIEPER